MNNVRRYDESARVFNLTSNCSAICDRYPFPINSNTIIMSLLRAKKLDIGSFVHIKNIRDHTKRKIYNENEAERYDYPLFDGYIEVIEPISNTFEDKP
jgi:hypothetical protein